MLPIASQERGLRVLIGKVHLHAPLYVWVGWFIGRVCGRRGRCDAQRHKIVVLEDLAATFHLKTQETIDRVNRLEKSGRITGVVDDRGKFIYIEPQEMEKVRWQLAWARFRGSGRNVA